MYPNQSPYQDSNYSYTPPGQSRGTWLKRALLIVVGLVVVGCIVMVVTHKKAATKTPTTTTAQSVTNKVLTTDEKQKNGAQIMLGTVEKYASDHNGAYPTGSAALQGLLTDYKTDTLGHVFIYKEKYSTADLPNSFRTMFYYGGFKCKNREAVASSSRSVAIVYLLSNGTYVCVAN